MHRPDLVDRLVLIGQYCNSSGKVTNGIVDQLLGGGDEVMACLRGGYDPFSPDGPEQRCNTDGWRFSRVRISCQWRIRVW